MSAEPSSNYASEFDEERNPVDLLADEFAHRIRIGETPSIDDYAKRYPDVANEIRAVFPAIAKIEKASRHQLSKSGSMPANQLVDLNLEKIGDFQIIRQIGHGGMGIVYEALQVSLQRKVALKVISPVISNSPKQLARFKREAATAANLHHTNIVPVFGSGEENGIPADRVQHFRGLGGEVREPDSDDRPGHGEEPAFGIVGEALPRLPQGGQEVGQVIERKRVKGVGGQAGLGRHHP